MGTQTIAVQGDLEAVVEQLVVRDQKRARRKERASTFDYATFTEDLDDLRVHMAQARRLPPALRDSAFAVLGEDKLAILERALTVYEQDGRFVHSNHDDEIVQLLLPLRANHVCGREVLDGTAFRAAARALFQALLEYAMAFAIPHARLERLPFIASRVVCVLAWRASLVPGEVCRSAGIAHFWHIGITRDERTLWPSVYHEHVPSTDTRLWPHCIVEPMLATGGTLMRVIEHLRTHGVPLQRIVVVSAIAAPEGVDRILHTYPGVRIVAGALDGHLDARGFIASPGLGDFGDLAMRGVDPAYAHAHWVQPGMLSQEQASMVLERVE